MDEASKNGREQFNKATNPQPEQQGIDSEQVKNTQPFIDGPKPPGSTRPAQDRLTHQQKMQIDHEKAMKVYDAAKAGNEQNNQLDLNKDKNGPNKNNDDRSR